MTTEHASPQAGNPGSWDRYTYCLNNPVNFIDPSGRFTEEAIYQYLLDTYGNEKIATSILNVWKQDKEWWAMLREAKAGDILFGVTTQNNYPASGFGYEFTGQGEDVLTGIQAAEGFNNSLNSKVPTLAELRNSQGPFTGELPSGSADAWFWVGLVRHSLSNGKPEFPYTRSGFDRSYYYGTEQDRKLVSYLTGTAFVVLGAYVPNIPAKAAAIVGVLLLMGNDQLNDQLYEALNISPNDLRIDVGPCQFFYHLNFPAGDWILETFQ